MSSEFGIYRVSYVPTTWQSTSYVEPTIDMSISGEADLSQMLSFFDSFLKASGYVYDGDLQIVEPRKETLKNTIGIDEFGNFYPPSSYGSGPSFGAGAACPSKDAVAIGTRSPWDK
jgi:hypothetical protein